MVERLGRRRAAVTRSRRASADARAGHGGRRSSISRGRVGVEIDIGLALEMVARMPPRQGDGLDIPGMPTRSSTRRTMGDRRHRLGRGGGAEIGARFTAPFRSKLPVTWWLLRVDDVEGAIGRRHVADAMNPPSLLLPEMGPPRPIRQHRRATVSPSRRGGAIWHDKTGRRRPSLMARKQAASDGFCPHPPAHRPCWAT